MKKFEKMKYKFLQKSYGNKSFNRFLNKIFKEVKEMDEYLTREVKFKKKK